MMNILRFLIPHFINRCILLDENQNLINICHGQKVGGDLFIEPAYYDEASKAPTIRVSLGLSWFGYAIFFWVKEEYVRIKT